MILRRLLRLLISTQLWASIGALGFLITAGLSFYTFQSDQKRELRFEEDRASQAVLQSYIRDIKELQLAEKTSLADSKIGSASRQIARALTITAVRQLDGERKGILMRFLFESQLIQESTKIIQLNDVDLSNADLSGLNLSDVLLKDANLKDANLIGTFLFGANLSGAILSGADLTGSTLTGADLSRADLTGADLSGANLTEVNFAGADLTNADLSDAVLINVKGTTDDQLARAKYPAIVIFSTQVPAPNATATPTMEPTVPQSGSEILDCFEVFFQEVPIERIIPVELGSGDFNLFEPPQTDQGIFGIAFIVGSNPLGGIKLIPFPEAGIFQVVSVLSLSDLICAETEDYANASQGGHDILLDYDELEMFLGNDVFYLSLAFYEGNILVNYFE